MIILLEKNVLQRLLSNPSRAPVSKIIQISQGIAYTRSLSYLKPVNVLRRAGVQFLTQRHFGNYGACLVHSLCHNVSSCSRLADL